MANDQSSSSLPAVLVRRGLSRKSARIQLWASAALGVSILIMMAAMFWLLAPNDPEALEKIWNKWASNPKNILESLGLMLVIVAHVVVLYVGRRDRLVIGPDSIAYQTPLPDWLPAILAGWNLPWTRIKKAEIRLPMGMAQPVLFLSDGTKSRKILVNAWVKMGEEKPKQKPSIQDLFRYRETLRAPSFEEMMAHLGDSPLIQALRAHRVQIEYPGQAATGLMFDLQSHPRTKVAVVVLIGLLGYAAIDTFFIDETYVENFQWTTWGVAGLITALLAQRWIDGPKIPKFVSFGLAAMVGLSVGVALYPGLLRLNQLTDNDGLQPHEYILRDYAQLEPIEDGLPTVRFNHYSDYWRQFPLDSTHFLYLRRGGLGFYQLDQAPLVDEMRAYYETQNKTAPTSKRR